MLVAVGSRDFLPSPYSCRPLPDDHDALRRGPWSGDQTDEIDPGLHRTALAVPAVPRDLGPWDREPTVAQRAHQPSPDIVDGERPALVRLEGERLGAFAAAALERLFYGL